MKVLMLQTPPGEINSDFVWDCNSKFRDEISLRRGDCEAPKFLMIKVVGR